MSITPGRLRALTQPTIILRLNTDVPAAPGETAGRIGAGFVFAQYVGNGRLLLTPIGVSMWESTVVMASALNATSTVVEGRDVVAALYEHDRLENRKRFVQSGFRVGSPDDLVGQRVTVRVPSTAGPAIDDEGAWDASDPTYDPLPAATARAGL